MNIIKKLVVKNLILNKKRTIVSIIGIVLAIALLTALFSITVNFRAAIIEREKKDSGNYHVMFQNVESEDVEKYEQNRLIENIYTERALGFAVLEGSTNEYKPYTYVTSFDIESLKDAPFNLCEGRMPENSSEIVISRHVNTNGRVGLKVGDVITLNIGKRVATDREGNEVELDIYYEYLTFGEEEIVDTKEYTFTIVGMVERANYRVEPYSSPGYTFVTVADSPQPVDTYDKVYIQFTDEGLRYVVENTAALLGIDGRDSELFCVFNDVDSGARLENTEDEWQEYFSSTLAKIKYNWEFNIYLIRYQRIWPIDSMFVALFVIAGMVGLVIMATSVYCIKNSFEISVTEKIRLYGMLSGIGATKRQIKRSVLFEAAAIGMVGLPGGIALGIFASAILCKISNVLLAETFMTEHFFSFQISWIAIGISVLLGVLTIYFSSISAMVKAGKITPIEAIRNTNEIKLDAKKIKAPGYISKIWGIGGTIAYKNIKRNKRKYRTTVVSIAICTITFIVVSYFMSMLFDVTSIEYSNETSNLSLTISEADINYEDAAGYLDEFEEIERISYVAYELVRTEGCEYGSNVQKLLGLSDEEMEAYNSDVMIRNLLMWILDDYSYKQYLNDCRKSVKDGEVVFYNYMVEAGAGKVRAYEYKDNILNVYREDYDLAEFDENDELIEDSVVKYYCDLKVGAESDMIPFGLAKQNGLPAVIMSATTYDMLGLEDKLVSDRFIDEIFIYTGKPDELQDEIEKMLNDNTEVFGNDVNIFNRDKNAKEEKSLYTLIAIFAYGLIIVIALIGITNIINTLGTSMELRAKDFATLRSIGMTNGQFRRMILLESIFTSAKSLIIGTITGCGITVLFWMFMSRNGSMILYKPPVAAIIICIAVVLILVYFIISTSLGRINKRNIIETIKNENA